MAAADPAFGGPDLCRLTACAAVDLLRRRQVSPAELIDASLARIAQTSPAINATVTLCADRARAASQAVDASSPLAGLPIGVKDLTPVAGVRTTWGSPALADFVPEASDPLVLRLEAQGGIVIGKTNTPEMGAGANTFNPVFGMTRNPWDTRMNAAGSSGGAAAGLAAGEVWLSTGSDVGGSLRTPASFCGIVGLRPTPGRVISGNGHDGFNLFSVEGPMARTVEDCALFLDAMAGWDASSPISFPAPETGFLETCRADTGAIRIAFSPDLGGLAPVEPEMAAILADALRRMQAPDVDVTEETPDVTGLSETFRTFRGLGMWTGFRATPKRVSDAYKATLKQNIAEGGRLTVDQIADAQRNRSRLYETMQRFLTRFDVLACPISGIGPLPVEIEYPPSVAGVASRDYIDWLSFAFLATTCGLPALSLPVGRDARGLPVGLQLIGPPRGEARLLQVARRLEQAAGFPRTPIDPVVTHTA
ncbi:amidase [Maliponia aquimaris]|uniref:Acylamidase n=1 Tax=Maliponia aquimaris TaxID=1673631 RepID=A0A238K522_9RHOB|nr:amidase family protein [Maliponia aquimaris]SMX38008.1 Acylamidase [Maliponia aquimaris]